ncbi:acyl-CoA dehydrogenase family protein [Streptomyces cavernae]|uniref:acyl-CoA dehydrogenase family protein n=1 Tax=Streptomyces cavernae TaxID=2259034 RepID=UPI000FEB673F|nr:acyl-CoA dehydrogenase family protein [Streptomyces cavernae]
MRFLLTTEQRDFAASLDAMLTAAGTPSVVRSWSAGDRAPGRALWSRLADAGLFALAVPETYEGVGPLPVELAAAFVELGRHTVPGPLVEMVAACALLAGLSDPGPAKRLLPGVVSGETMVTVGAPYALDGDAADLVLTVEGERLRLTSAAQEGPPRERPGARSSLDPARRLTLPSSGGELLSGTPAPEAFTYARLTTAAQALGVGLALLDRTVAYVGQRHQFGVPVGSFQAVKHQLAEAMVGLEFARPLVFGAAVTLDPVDVAAAKVAACEAAYAAARTALQLHGAIGYTAECDLSLWLTKARALRTAWGSPSECRAAVLGDGGLPRE